MVIPGVVDGHTIRSDPHIDAGAAVNMFPEFGRPAGRDQAAPPRFMLPTHGFNRDGLPLATHPPVTGLSGTRERIERLLAAFGRQFVAFADNPRETIFRDASGDPVRHFRPAYGACQVGDFTYWVRDDGTVRVKAADGQPLDVFSNGQRPQDEGVTPLGMACTSDGTNVVYVFFTCFEDRRVRVWKRGSGSTLERQDRKFDLDLGDETAINAPESMWLGSDNRLLILDAVGGRIVEYLFDPDNKPYWTLQTPPGLANPLNLQRIIGVDNEPVHLGGIHATGNHINVVNRLTGEGVQIIRSTGVFNGNFNLGAAGKAVCGAVNGADTPTPTWYVNGAQLGGDGKFYRGGALADDSPSLPDEAKVSHTPTPLVPLGDTGRLMGWVADRRLHLIDLDRNRVLLNVEGNVDGLDYATGRFIAVNAVEGRLKISPVDQIRVSTERYGAAVAFASMSLPGYPRSSPFDITSVFVGLRVVLAVMVPKTSNDNKAAGFLYRYERSDLNKTLGVPPSGPTARVRAVCVANDRTAVVEDGNNAVVVKLYDTPPTTQAEYDAPGATRNITLGFSPTFIRAVACDGERLFVVHVDGNNARELSVFTMPEQPATGEVIGQLSGSAFARDDDDLFAGLTLDTADSWLRGITFVDGRLLAALKQTAPNPTVVRAYEFSPEALGSGWSRAASRDIVSGVSTDNRMLTHDGLFLFDAPDALTPGVIDSGPAEGDPVERLPVAAHRITVDKISKYSWDPLQSLRTGAKAIKVLRNTLYSWTNTGMEVRQFSAETDGFPYLLASTYNVGLVAPWSVTAVSDAIYWLGSTPGGGLRAWRVGNEREIVTTRVDGNLVPEAIRGEAIEEMLSRIAEEREGALEEIIGWSDDLGGHPSYVMHSRRGGISMAYDAESDRWHTRSSLRSGTDTVLGWDWLDSEQGAQRVTHSTSWKGRLVCGGFDRSGNGVIAFASVSDWQDIDGGKVTRARQFSGLTFELKSLKRGPMRIHVAYDVDGGPTVSQVKYTLQKSDDGGLSFEPVGEQEFGLGNGVPAPFNLLGVNANQVFRIESSSNAPFIVHAVYLDQAAISAAKWSEATR